MKRLLLSLLCVTKLCFAVGDEKQYDPRMLALMHIVDNMCGLCNKKSVDVVVNNKTLHDFLEKRDGLAKEKFEDGAPTKSLVESFQRIGEAAACDLMWMSINAGKVTQKQTDSAKIAEKLEEPRLE